MHQNTIASHQGRCNDLVGHVDIDLSVFDQVGKIDVDMSDEIIASSLVTREGVLVHAGALEAMNVVGGGKKKCGCNCGSK